MIIPMPDEHLRAHSRKLSNLCKIALLNETGTLAENHHSWPPTTEPLGIPGFQTSRLPDFVPY
jgi:hypothetical protein